MKKKTSEQKNCTEVLKRRCGLQDDFTVNRTGNAGGVGFIRIDVHSGRIFGADANHDITEGQGTTAAAINFHRNNLLVRYAGSSSFFHIKVNMTLGGNNALFRW